MDRKGVWGEVMSNSRVTVGRKRLRRVFAVEKLVWQSRKARHMRSTSRGQVQALAFAVAIFLPQAHLAARYTSSTVTRPPHGARQSLRT